MYTSVQFGSIKAQRNLDEVEQPMKLFLTHGILNRIAKCRSKHVIIT